MKHQFIKYLRFLEIFSFNSLNLVIANKAFAAKVVMDVMVAFNNSKEDKTLGDHKESNDMLMEAVLRAAGALLRNQDCVITFLQQNKHYLGGLANNFK